MGGGVVRRTELLRALRALGGQARPQGGEVCVWFPGTTIIVGRRAFSRAMLRRVVRKLAAAGIRTEQFWKALYGKAYGA